MMHSPAHSLVISLFAKDEEAQQPQNELGPSPSREGIVALASRPIGKDNSNNAARRMSPILSMEIKIN